MHRRKLPKSYHRNLIVDVHIKSRFGEILLRQSANHGFDEVVTLDAAIAQASDPAFPGSEVRLLRIPDPRVVKAKDFFLMFSSDSTRRGNRSRSRGALLFRPRIVLGTGISDAPPRGRTHANRPVHLGSDRRSAADFRCRGVVIDFAISFACTRPKLRESDMIHPTLGRRASAAG
jgi:hypothetical protein